MKKILVIDDSEVMLKMLIKALRDTGYQARGTMDLIRFGQMLQEYHPDLVLVDVMMPEVFGDAVCRDLKDQFQGLGAPVYLISSMAEGELDNRARLCGADGYISKRNGFSKVLARIGEIMAP